MKKFLTWTVIIFIVFGVIGMIIDNEEDEPTSDVGENPGDDTPDTPDNPDPHEHIFIDGKCSCGANDPGYDPPKPNKPSTHEHSFVDGKCECGEEDPNYVPPTPDDPGTHEHSFVDGKCECGEEDPNYVPSTPDDPGTHEHSFADGKCECGEEDPNYVPPTVDPVLSTLTYVDAESSEHSNPTQYTVGTPLTLLDAERRGYTFLGWYNSNNEKISEISSTATGDITLTAKWELATYTITYENTKTADISSYVKTYTMLDADILLPTISLDGYTFGGWEIEGQRVTSIKSGSVGNIVVKAILIPPQYTLLLETPYGKLESKTVTVGYGEHYTLPVLSYEGKSFLGWYDNTGDSGVQYTDGNGNSVAPYPHTSGRMLYARFEALSCIVSYDTMGGDTVSSTYVDYGSAFDDSVIPTKENAIFAGWYNSDFSSRYTAGSVISSDLTVYAKWIESTPISTAEELMAIRNNPSGNYYLTGDINLNGAVWTPIDTFSGTLDGKGYKIKNFAIHTPSYITPYGFIRTNNGTIQNITFADCTFNVSATTPERAGKGASLGVFVGLNNGKIYNCCLESGAISVSFTINYASKNGEIVALGSICGKNSGHVVGCSSSVSITFSLLHTSDYGAWDDDDGTGMLGGVVGWNTGKVSTCCYEGVLTYSARIYTEKSLDGNKIGALGGIVGQSNSNATVSDSFANVTITASTSNTENDNNHKLYMGGIVGRNYGNLTTSYATGDITGKNAATIDIGGAVGHNASSGSIMNCYAKTNVSSPTGSSVGGFIGYNDATIQNCYATGTVNSKGNTGGFVGCTGTGSTISKCYSTGDVTSTSSNSGFFIGANSGILYNCYFMRGAMLLVNGQYKDYMVEKDVVEGISYSTIWSKEFLVDMLYWDSEGWIILANEDPILEWEISVDHNYNKIIIEPTCTTFGFTVYKCTDCDRYFIMDVVAEHGHEITHSTIVAPTCTERGYTASYCSRCDETVATDLVEPTGHTLGELVEHHAPTCTEDGYDIYSCSVCSVQKATIVILEATGHTEVVVPAVEQTCTETGKTERIYCGVCKTLIKASTVIEPHFYHITVTLEPTCTEAGECTKYCVVCEHTVEGAAVAPTGHTDLNGDILCDTCGVICGEYADDVLVEISTAEQLAGIKDNLNGVYRLMANITLPSGWSPIGSEDAPFTGFLDGNGYKITLCSFENKSTAGIFGYNDGVITNLAVAATGFTVSNMNAVVGGIAAYNSGLIIGCNLSGTFDLTVISTHTSSAHELSRVMRNVVFGGIVGINDQGGRLVSCNYDAVMQVSLENTALCTAKYGVFDYIDITGKYKNIITESIVTLTVSPVVGRNGGEIVKCRAFGGVMLGRSGNGSGLPSADAQHFVGNASAESIYYYGDIAGYNYGTVSECENWHTVEMNVSTDEEHYSFLFCSEREKNLVYLTFTGES